MRKRKRNAQARLTFMKQSRYVLATSRSKSSVMWPPYMISPKR